MMVLRAVPLDKVIARPRRRSPQASDAKGRPHIGYRWLLVAFRRLDAEMLAPRIGVHAELPSA